MSLHRTRPYVFAIVFLLVAWWAPQLAPMTARAAPAPVQSQDEATHPRVMQQTAQSEATASVGPQQPFRPSTTPRVVRPNVTNSNTKEVFGFGLFSSLSDPNIGYPSWNFSLLSTVAVFGVHVNWDGHLVTSDSSWAVWNSSQMTNLLNTAHAAGTKVVLTIVLQDFSSGTVTMCDGLFHRAVTVSETVAQVKAKGVDGVNVDYEGWRAPAPPARTRGSQWSTSSGSCGPRYRPAPICRSTPTPARPATRPGSSTSLTSTPTPTPSS